MTNASQRLCYTLSWLLVNVTLVGQDYVTKNFANATRRASKIFILMSGKSLRATTTNGSLLSWRDYVKGLFFKGLKKTKKTK